MPVPTPVDCCRHKGLVERDKIDAQKEIQGIVCIRLSPQLQTCRYHHRIAGPVFLLWLCSESPVSHRLFSRLALLRHLLVQVLSGPFLSLPRFFSCNFTPSKSLERSTCESQVHFGHAGHQSRARSHEFIKPDRGHSHIDDQLWSTETHRHQTARSEALTVY